MSQDIFSEPTPDFFDQSPTIPVPERSTIVPSWYQRHADPQGTVVTQNGAPIHPGFTVSEVAPELRWAIGEDGEVLGQLEFKQQHERFYIEQYRFFKQPADDPNVRSVPRVERFVAQRIDPHKSERLQRISKRPEGSLPVIAPRYNADGDLIAEAGEVEAPKGMSVKPAENPVQPPVPVEEIEQQARAESIAKGKDPDYKAPCGKPFPAGKRYLHLHSRHCEDPACAKE